jgi:hypothetical protein
MRRALAALVIATIAVPAAAQELRQTLAPPAPGGIEQIGNRLVMSSQICATLGIDPGVPGAAYQEGVDVNGRRVAPADLPSDTPPLKIDNFPIEISKDLAGKFNVPATGGAYGAKAIVGYVTLRENRVYFNGQPLGDDQRNALAETCRAPRP